MAEFKLTASEGLKAQDKENPWEGFYSEEADPWEGFSKEEDQKQQKEAETKVAETKTESEGCPDDSEAEEEKDRSESNTKQEVTVFITENNSHTEAHDEKDNSSDEKHADNPSEEKRPKKRKVKKSRSCKSQAPSTNTYPTHSQSHRFRNRSPSDRYSTSPNRENNKQRGRKLHRRRQMQNEYSLEQAGQERLEQKFLELEELMTRPLGDTRGRTSQQRLQRVIHLRHLHAQNGYEEQVDGSIGCNVEGGEDNQAYSTIRSLQTSGPSLHLKVIYDRQSESPRLAGSPRSRLPPKPSTPQHSSRGSVDSPTTSSSGRSQSRYEKENGFGGYFSEGERSRSSDDDTSPHREYVPIYTHLKYTDNPKLREWLKRKDAEYRKARKAERIKKREERNEKMVEAELKIAHREKSSERVKKWMEVKRKEAIMRQKAERQKRKQEAEAKPWTEVSCRESFECLKEEQQKKKQGARCLESGLRGTRIDRPRTAPTKKSSYVLIKRPNSAARLDEGDGSNSKPADTKFVYKQSVAGRVQLMKLQNERNARARSADQQRYDELSAEERQNKAKTSYDAWLLAKKEQEMEKMKAAKRQKEAMQSDPEMECIIPEMARRRIERIKNGKKTLDTGLHRSTADSGGEEVETQEGERQEGEDDSGGPKPSSYKLAVSGVAATITTSNKRPASARARTPKPHKASSPQRPKSASATSSSKQRVNGVAETPTSESNAFKLPFPDDFGVPYHVKRVQERIFSPELNAQSGDGERPEPQGCAAVESGACPKGADNKSSSDSTPRASLVLLQEIEAAAIQSEQAAQEATFMAVQKAAKSSGSNATSGVAGEEDSQEQEAKDSEQPTEEEPDEEPAQELDEPDIDEAKDEEEQGAEQEEEQNEEEEADTTENKEDITEESDQPSEQITTEDAAEENKEEVTEENDDNNDNDDAAEDEPQEEGPVEEEDEEQQAEDTLEQSEDFAEENECQTIAEPEEEQVTESVAEVQEEQVTEMAAEAQEEQAIETTVEDKEESEEQDEEQTASQPDPSEDNQTDPQDANNSGDAEQEMEDSELDSSLRKSEKHVSFSEDLATVFEPGSAELSSSFEDEQGFVDDEQDAQ